MLLGIMQKEPDTSWQEPALVRLINEFSLDLVVRQHLNIYRELLGERWPG
jgi:hypothetical protein